MAREAEAEAEAAKCTSGGVVAAGIAHSERRDMALIASSPLRCVNEHYGGEHEPSWNIDSHEVNERSYPVRVRVLAHRTT